MNTVNGVVFLAAGMAMFNPGLLEAAPGVNPVITTVETDFTLTEQCTGSALIGNVAVFAQMGANNSTNVNPDSPMNFNKILQFGMDLCGDDKKIVNEGTLTRSNTTGRILKVTLDTNGVELSRPLFNQTSRANCTPLRATDTNTQINSKRGVALINSLRSKEVPCDSGFVAADGSAEEPTDENVVLFPTIYKASEAALINDSALVDVVQRANVQRTQKLRDFLLRTYKPKKGIAPVIDINQNLNGLQSRRTEYARMTVQDKSATITNSDGNNTAVIVSRGRSVANASVQSISLPKSSSKFAIHEDTSKSFTNIR